MSKKKSNPFAIGEDGKRYVEAEAIMHRLIPFCDGLEVTFFGKSKTMYLGIDTAIDWVRQEMGTHNRDKYELILQALIRFKETDEKNMIETETK